MRVARAALAVDASVVRWIGRDHPVTPSDHGRCSCACPGLTNGLPVARRRDHRSDRGYPPWRILAVAGPIGGTCGVMSQEYAAALGQRLRAARRQRGLPSNRSRSSPRAGGRGGRRLLRTCSPRGHRDPAGRARGVLRADHCRTPSDLPGDHPAGSPLARYAWTIQQHRGDHGGTVRTIREQDLQSRWPSSTAWNRTP